MDTQNKLCIKLYDVLSHYVKAQTIEISTVKEDCINMV